MSRAEHLARRAPAESILVGGIVYVLHQDLWFWRDAHPLVFGFLPIGIFYHAAYTVVSSLVLWALLPALWPRLDEPRPGDALESRDGPPSLLTSTSRPSRATLTRYFPGGQSL